MLLWKIIGAKIGEYKTYVFYPFTSDVNSYLLCEHQM